MSSYRQQLLPGHSSMFVLTFLLRNIIPALCGASVNPLMHTLYFPADRMLTNEHQQEWCESLLGAGSGCALLLAPVQL